MTSSMTRWMQCLVELGWQQQLSYQQPTTCWLSPAEAEQTSQLLAAAPTHTVIPAESRCTEFMHTPHTHPFNGPLSRTTRVSRYQKGKTNLDFSEARDSEWQWHQLGHMQVCTSLQADNHASTPPLSFLQAGCPSCRRTNSVKALKGNSCTHYKATMQFTSSLHARPPVVTHTHTHSDTSCLTGHSAPVNPTISRS